MEKTLVLVKPDGVERNLIGEIIRRFEQRGLVICGLKMLQMTREQAGKHYEEHKDKPFFGELVDFITSGPIVAIAVGGDKVVQMVRTMMGTTNPVEALPGTIRGDFAVSIASNVIHGSDSPASAKRELAIYFEPYEIMQ